MVPHTLITGANRGIGHALALRALGRGHRVTAAVRRPDDPAVRQLNDAHAGRFAAVAYDAADPDAAARLRDAAAHGPFGVPDRVWVNAAIGRDQTLGGFTAAAFAETFAVNVTGPALLLQAFGPVLGRGAGVAVLSSGMASSALNINPAGPYAGYSASKAAVTRLVAALRPAFAERGVALAAVSPGWVKTDMGGPDAPTEPADAAATLCATMERLAAGEIDAAFTDEHGATLPF